jgi:3-isopropylmalate/(R)-2-methylmalate dehydratase large subunit
MAVHLQGTLPAGVSAKDLILAVIGEIGVDGGTGHVIEYRGEAIASMSMEERMTICNMSIEAGARAGMIAPDQTTIDDLRGRPMSPTGADWDVAVERWKNLPTDEGATYDAEVTIDVSNLQPMITFGTNPGMVMGIGNTVPANDDPAFVNALEYMGIKAGESLLGKPIDVVFIGSCTNARLSDLRQAAQMMAGRQVADGVRALVVPGSQQVKRAAEAEGLHEVFTKAGADWRESGCSMCIAMNGDRVESGQYAVSTSNRNFAGRQGPGARTFLASPATAAAAAIAGRVVDPRELLAEGRTG